MPNKKAAIKSLRQDAKKHEKNNAVKAELRTLVKKSRALISEKKLDEAQAILKELESKLDRAAKSNIIKKQNASRRISRVKSQFAKAKV